MSYLETKFSYYDADIKRVKPLGDITLQQFINAVISPKPQLLETFKKIEEASKAGDNLLKAELKKGLFAVTPCVEIKGIRNYEGIAGFTGLCVIEYDKIPHAAVLRDYIFKKFDSCIFAFLSPSKSGCKFIFNIKKVNTILEYKEMFFGIAHSLDKLINLDYSGANAVLPLFISNDADAKFREDATVWTRRGYKEGAFVPFTGHVELPDDMNEADIEECIRIATYGIDSIVSEGHPTVVKISFLCGGLAASGYIEEELIYNTIEDLIKSNDYLAKGLDGYLTTFKTMFNKGLGFPALLNRHKNE